MNPVRSLLLLAAALVGEPRGLNRVNTHSRIVEVEPAPIAPVVPPKPAKQNVFPAYRRRFGRSKGNFRYFGSRVSYHHDPTTSATNRHKRATGGNFCGRTGQYQHD